MRRTALALSLLLASHTALAGALGAITYVRFGFGGGDSARAYEAGLHITDAERTAFRR